MTRERKRGKPMTTDSTSSAGALSLKGLEPLSRKDADTEREAAERFGVVKLDGRKRRKLGRTEPISVRTFPEIKNLINAMAEAEGRSYVEIIEDAIRTRHNSLKGQK
jgi:hypothetical protein